MGVLQILRILKNVNVRRLINLPDLSSSADTRAWCVALADAGEYAVQQTETTVDDEFVAALRAVVDNDDVWTYVHALIVKWTADGLEAQDVHGCSASPECETKAKLVGINPLAVLTVVRTVVEAIRVIRDIRAQ